MTYYFMYKITNKLNDKFYIGVHKTNKIDDGYYGSGIVIKASIKKYGKENHTKEILSFFENKEDMYAMEFLTVSQELLSNDKCMNLKVGGKGGWPVIKITNEMRKNRSDKSKELWANDEFRTKIMIAKTAAEQRQSTKLKKSIAAKKNWQDPIWKQKFLLNLKEIMTSDFYRENMSEVLKITWADQELRDKQSRILIKYWEGQPIERKENFVKRMNTDDVKSKRSNIISKNAKERKIKRTKEQMEEIKKSNIDFTKEGWAEQVGQILKSSKINCFIKINFPEIFKICWFKCPKLVKYN